MGISRTAGVLLSVVLPASSMGAKPPPAAPAPPPASTRTCKVQFTGTAFLAAAAQRGREPKQVTPCFQVQTANNTFHARPKTVCTLFFANSEWLPGGGTFKGMSGQGSFTANAEPGGFRITIGAGGGFYLNQVTIAATGKFQSCKEATLDYVLDGG